MQAPSLDRKRDTLTAISRHVRGSVSRINRMSASQERVLRALRDEPPQGVSRIDWIARKLNSAEGGSLPAGRRGAFGGEG